MENGALDGATLVGQWVQRRCADAPSSQPCNGEYFYHDSNHAKGAKAASFTMTRLVYEADYVVSIMFSSSPSRASAIPVTIGHAGGADLVVLNQRQTIATDDGFLPLGVFRMVPGSSFVNIRTAGTSGKVIVDALRLTCVNGGLVTTRAPTPAPTSSPTLQPTVPTPTASPTEREPFTPTAQPTAVPTPSPTVPCADVTVDVEGSASTADYTVNGRWVERSCFTQAPPGQPCVGSVFLHDANSGKGTNNVIIHTGSLAKKAIYDVAVSYTVSRSRADQVPVTIGSSLPLLVNQRSILPEADGFFLLGQHVIVPGVTTVTIANDGTSGKVIVDAVRFRCVEGSGPGGVTLRPTAQPTPLPTPACVTRRVDAEGAAVDGGLAVFTGRWVQRSCARNVPLSQPCEGDHFYHDGNTGKGELSVRFDAGSALAGLVSGGRYEVLVSYSVSGSRATEVPVTVRDATGAETVVAVNQQVLPSRGDGFHSLGVFTLGGLRGAAVEIGTAGTEGKVVVDAVEYVCADGLV